MTQTTPKIGIIVIGYNRMDCISRMLNRLNDCDYPEDAIPLVISLDNCGKDDVRNYAESFRWLHGGKTVIHQPERLGLRKHILKCGSYIETFDWDAAIVLEDDGYPAAPFYRYALQAVACYKDDDRIAGISLFTMTQNRSVQLPFFPAYTEYDAFFMQLAQSLGQVWMRRQWKQFIDWYETHNETFREHPSIPENIAHWPDTSWLKYHIRYCVEENKYFVYPYQSLTTNFDDAGTHTGIKSMTMQTPLQQFAKEKYSFPTLGKGGYIYNVWCENIGIRDLLPEYADELCIDLYGARKTSGGKRYWLTSLSKPYRIIRSFGLELRPIDMNVLCGLKGESLFLYDTEAEGAAPVLPDRDIAVWSYYNTMVYPDDAIRKLSIPIRKKIRRARFGLLLHPAKLVRKLIGKLK